MSPTTVRRIIFTKTTSDGTFTDVSFETGTSYSGAGDEQGSMGVAFGDYDSDGNLDIFTTNFDNEQNTLYRNLGSKGFLMFLLKRKSDNRQNLMSVGERIL